MLRKACSICIALMLGLTASTAGVTRIETLDHDITALVDRVSKSIVSIATVSRSADGRVARSIGSGVVFDANGIVLSTASVVGNAHEVEVGTVGGKRHTGTVIGIDPATDLAVIKVEGLQATPAKFSSEEHYQPGSLVFVIGNAYGRLPSVTMGVISAAPTTMGEDGGQEMLRLAVPVNPGDIGAPLVSSGGEVLGLMAGRLSLQPWHYSMRDAGGPVFNIAQIMQQSNVSVGLPSYRVVGTALEIIEEGGRQPGFLGVRVAEIRGEMGGDIDEGGALKGVVVTSVVSGSPAESIGLEPGDVIKRFGNTDIMSATLLRDMVWSTSPGEVITLSFVRREQDFMKGVRMANRSPARLRATAYGLKPEEIDMRIKLIQDEIDRLEKELSRLQESR